MFKESKYFGEVWLPENNKELFFCVLEIKDREIYLETNLSSEFPEYKKDIIYGKFNGLGSLTFVNNQIEHSSLGVINVRRYNPEYTFVANAHFVEPQDLQIKEFKVDNKALNLWGGRIHTYDFLNQTLNINNSRNEIFNKDNINVRIEKSALLNIGKESFGFATQGIIFFNMHQDKSLMECMSIYDSFQKFLLFFYGKSSQFESFKFKCSKCGDWISLYYVNHLSFEGINNFLRIDFESEKHDFNVLLSHWFNNVHIEFCIDIIIENMLSAKVGHNRRFTNSLSAFEAYCQRFNNKHLTLEKYFLEFKSLLSTISGIEESQIKPFIKRIIRSRNFYVHGSKNQKNGFTKFELLYISFLIDYVVGIKLSEYLGFNQETIDRMISQAKSVYQDMQRVNGFMLGGFFNKD